MEDQQFDEAKAIEMFSTAVTIYKNKDFIHDFTVQNDKSLTTNISRRMAVIFYIYILLFVPVYFCL